MSPPGSVPPPFLPNVRVSATGHRTLADPAAVAGAVDRALERILAGSPGRGLTLISALAEGADRLAAERALAIDGTRLVLLLPLPETEYLETFESEASRDEYRRLESQAEGGLFALPVLPAEEAFQEHAEHLVGMADVMLAVWDGGPPRGPGGTADVVARAREAGSPLAWVRAGRAGGAAGAELVWERFPTAATAE